MTILIGRQRVKNAGPGPPLPALRHRRTDVSGSYRVNNIIILPAVYGAQLKTALAFTINVQTVHVEQVKSSQVKLPLIKTSDNRTNITCRNGNKIAKTSNIKV